MQPELSAHLLDLHVPSKAIQVVLSVGAVEQEPLDGSHIEGFGLPGLDLHNRMHPIFAIKTTECNKFHRLMKVSLLVLTMKLESVHNAPEILQTRQAQTKKKDNTKTAIFVENAIDIYNNFKFEDYCDPLKNTTKSCEFGELAESLIKDRLICGMLDDTLRERLLKERDLNLGRALEICKIHEAAKEQVKNISNSKSSNVDSINNN
ncbi:K02A2.6-like [Cordylochernes scorpioides]|uniref:K02A2.6-like n=1 Tax=Cordylochernes scorpioides TaxID=51811 RepID=A0ABY6LCH1_9ARAC|nr:K02A2.6-like [Cordylochernes scorpioides]